MANKKDKEMNQAAVSDEQEKKLNVQDAQPEEEAAA